MGASPRQRMSAVERRIQALQLHLAGVDYRTIAKQVGYADGAAAQKGIDRAIEESIARGEEDTDTRTREVMRYNRLQAAHWGKAVKGDTKASDVVLKCMQGRERLLGLAAPKRINIDAQQLGDEILAILGEVAADDEQGAAP
ncbi:hypothetical protein [Streptomyces anulatus]|uniref:Helix-turn-helix domain-containing protein n=1 Tax=Streptomyces anulatus TaxID=1892 RepID=A0A7K3RMU0_STRAQ|nr:hypothetical protein [Streptomyces anulatus]NEC03425.1 hypothetical protein [Streptomyces anulatus]NED30725.1 hypothetical protein [Streptomyces anulatus]